MLRKLLILIIALLLFIPVVSARELLSASDCEVGSDQVVNGLLLVFCENLTISGEVNGDLIGAALRVHIDGTINGNIYLISGQLDFTGYMAGDMHFAGPVLRLNPPPSPPTEGDTAATLPSTEPDLIRLDGELKAITLSTTIFPNTLIKDTIMDFGYQLIIDGSVNGEVNFWGSLLMVDGEIGGDVYANVGDPSSESSQLETLLIPLNFDMSLRNPGLVIGEQGRINGNLTYSGPRLGLIDGQILGLTEYDQPPAVVPTLDEPGTFALYFEAFGREFSTLLVIGLLALVSMNKFLHAPLNTMRTRPFASIAVGMLAFLLSFPIVLIIIILSLAILGLVQLIGLSGVVLALSLVLGLVNIGGVSVFYFVAIFLARTLVGLGIGRAIMRFRFNRSDVEDSPMRYLALFVGVFLLALIVSLPVIGILFNALALFWGLGAILNEIITEFNRVRDNTPTATSVPRWYTASATVHPEPPAISSADIPSVLSPPPVEDQAFGSTPGSQNLPDGFDWSFFDE